METLAEFMARTWGTPTAKHAAITEAVRLVDQRRSGERMRSRLQRFTGIEDLAVIDEIIGHARAVRGRSYVGHEEHVSYWEDHIEGVEPVTHAPTTTETSPHEHYDLGGMDSPRPGWRQYITTVSWWNQERGRMETADFIVSGKTGESETMLFNRLMAAIRDRWNIGYNEKGGWGQLATEIEFQEGMFRVLLAPG